MNILIVVFFIGTVMMMAGLMWLMSGLNEKLTPLIVGIMFFGALTAVLAGALYVKEVLII